MGSFRGHRNATPFSRWVREPNQSVNYEGEPLPSGYTHHSRGSMHHQPERLLPNNYDRHFGTSRGRWSNFPAKTRQKHRRRHNVWRRLGASRWTRKETNVAGSSVSSNPSSPSTDGASNLNTNNVPNGFPAELIVPGGEIISSDDENSNGENNPSQQSPVFEFIEEELSLIEEYIQNEISPLPSSPHHNDVSSNDLQDLEITSLTELQPGEAPMSEDVEPPPESELGEDGSAECIIPDRNDEAKIDEIYLSDEYDVVFLE